MVWQQQKTHSPTKYRVLNIDRPGYGGLNIQDLDYTLPLDQSPKMLNMMVKNGAFGKRYGQKVVHTFNGNIINIGKYKGNLYLHIGTSLIKYVPSTNTATTIYTNSALTKKGVFINYNKTLYYLCNRKFIEWDGTTAQEVKAYAPIVVINRTPDGSYSGDIIEDFNRLGPGFECHFNGDGTSTTYKIMMPPEEDADRAGLDSTKIKVTIGTTTYTEGDSSGKIVSVNRSTGAVVLNSAPPNGQNNVIITAYKTYSKYQNGILDCKYWATYGGQNNSRLFVGGNGSASYFYSGPLDASYFPENNNAVIGNAEEDITGFGSQYKILVVFKPTEMYALDYNYVTGDDGFQEAQFYTAQINDSMGCDMPDTIHYVDNRLTWGSTQWGVCTLCSTVIEDERNVRVISRNINGGYREAGLLAENNLKNAVAVNFEGKYMMCLNGNVYAWDYTNSPYSTSDRISPDDAAKNLAWFKWNKINVTAYKVLERSLYYASGKNLCTFTNTVDDFGEPIAAYYQTPMIDFNAFDYLKTVKRAFFQVRGDTPVTINIKYLTEEMPDGEAEPEPISVPTVLWDGFKWSTFGWSFISFAETFARKCSVKKIEMFGVFLENSERNRDMSLSGLKFEYTTVKEVK